MHLQKLLVVYSVEPGMGKYILIFCRYIYVISYMIISNTYDHIQEDQSLASREGRWELCGPFINTCKRLLSVLLTAEPRSVIIILKFIQTFNFRHLYHH